MKCVKCDGALRKTRVGGVEVDKCDKCSGIWFDFGELQKALGEKDVEILKDTVNNSETEDVLKASCPACGGTGKMVQCASLQKKGVHIDTCSICCGQWLDGGELEKLKKKGLLKSIAGLFKSVF